MLNVFVYFLKRLPYKCAPTTVVDGNRHHHRYHSFLFFFKLVDGVQSSFAVECIVASFQ